MPDVLLDPDCRDGKHGSCVGEPCECECHFVVDQSGTVLGGRRLGKVADLTIVAQYAKSNRDTPSEVYNAACRLLDGLASRDEDGS